MTEILRVSSGTYRASRPGGFKCEWCKFRFSTESMLLFHKESSCSPKNVKTECDMCGNMVLSATYDIHFSKCFREVQARFLLENPPPPKVQDEHIPSLVEEYNGSLPTQDESVLIKYAELKSLEHLMGTNRLHAEAVISDNFDAAANRLDEYLREAKAHWNSGEVREYLARGSH